MTIFNNKMFRISMLLVVVAVITSACSISLGSAKTGVTSTNGGIYKSENFGSTWLNRSLISTVKNSISTFATANINTIVIDPNDRRAIYVGTRANGMLYSYDGGASFSIATSLGKRGINDVAVSIDNKCTVYVASANKIYKTTDCSRSWNQVYFDNDPGTVITSLATDPTNAAVLYAGTDRGELLKSTNSGVAWTTLYRFVSTARRFKTSNSMSVVKVIVNSRNASNIWVATKGEAVLRSMDRGVSWTAYKDAFSAINKDAVEVNDMALSAIDRTIVVATEAGVLRSVNLGSVWKNLDVIPPAKDTTVNRVAVADNADIIYYTTNTSIGVTKDGGDTWESKKLPTTRHSSALVLDPDDPEVVYLGVFLIEK